MRLKYTSLMVCLLLVGCNSLPGLNTDKLQNTPNKWTETNTLSDISDSWHEVKQDSHLNEVINIALNNNRALQRKILEVQSAEQQLIISGADLLPTLTSSLDYSEREQAGQSESVSNYSLGLAIKYELDLWGKLSDSERQASLNLMSLNESLKQQKLDLVYSVAKLWYELTEENQQQSLQSQRVSITKQNLDIIEKGYRQGLNSALDVYLGRNELNNEEAKLEEYKNNIKLLTRDLQQLMSIYPTGVYSVVGEFSNLSKFDDIGLPSDVIKRKPELQASWFKLLSQDAGLAFAHKQRFPSFNLSFSLDSSDESFSNTIRFDDIGWNFIAGITAPIFNAGKLKANEEKQRIALKTLELEYLDLLDNTFTTIENSLSTEQALKLRKKNISESAVNAKLAATLSFEQYKKGLVTYTTVLDAQKRSFDAQTAFISIQNQLIQNRLSLYHALGDGFATSTQE